MVNHDLARSQRQLRDAVTGLDHRGFGRVRGGGHVGGFGKELADRHGIGGVVCALVYHFEHVVCAQNTRRHLDATCAPTIRQWHFAAAKRHLVARDGNGFEQAAAYHALGLFVQIREVIVLSVCVRIHAGSTSLASSSAWLAPAWSRRILRINSNSDWKST